MAVAGVRRTGELNGEPISSNAPQLHPLLTPGVTTPRPRSYLSHSDGTKREAPPGQEDWRSQRRTGRIEPPRPSAALRTGAGRSFPMQVRQATRRRVTQRLDVAAARIARLLDPLRSGLCQRIEPSEHVLAPPRQRQMHAAGYRTWRAYRLKCG